MALACLRIGFALMVASAASDLLFAAIDHARALVLIEGAVLAAVAVACVARPERVANWLLPAGRVLVPAIVFAVAGTPNSGLQEYYSEVAPAIVWIAAIASSPRWTAACVAASLAGYIAHLLAIGHPVGWLAHGLGLTDVANQAVDLVANAGAVLLLVALLRRFVRTVPQKLEDLRLGGPALTVQLALAATGRPIGLLRRGDPIAITAPLTSAEREVVACLAQGLAPKEIALELHLTLAAIRKRLAAAKRKTGARTQEELVALHTQAAAEQRT